MKLVNLVDENGKEVKVNKDNESKFVILNAVELTKNSFPKRPAIIPTGKGSNVEHCTMNEFADNLLDEYTKNGVFNENTQIPQDVKNTAFATMRAAQIIYNLSLAEEIKTNIDNLANDAEIGKKFKPEVFEQAKAEIDNTIDNINHTNLNTKFVDSIKEAFKDHSKSDTDMKNFLNHSYLYIHERSKQLFDENFNENESFFSDDKNRGFDKKVIRELEGAIYDYVDSNSHKMDFMFSYGEKEDDVKPHEFLEHYKNDPNSLTDKEKDWVQSSLRRLEDMVAGKRFADHAGKVRVDLTDFKANGVQIVSDEELKNANDITQLECRIIAKMLSGEEITSQPKGSNELPIQINPNVVCKKPESILDQIIEFFKHLFDYETEKDKVKAMNESFDRNRLDERTKIERQKMTFGDLLDNKFNKINAPSKTEEDEIVVTISQPTKER